VGCRSGAIDWHGVFLNLISRRLKPDAKVNAKRFVLFDGFLTQYGHAVTVTLGKNSTVRYGTDFVLLAERFVLHHKRAIFRMGPLFFRKAAKQILRALRIRSR
jgi:hypothetical protein